MPVDKVIEDVQGGIAQAQRFLAAFGETVNTLAGGDVDVNANPVGGGIADTVTSTLDNVAKAAQLRRMLPWVFVAGGMLLGRPVLGIALAIVVHLAGQSSTAKAP